MASTPAERRFHAAVNVIRGLPKNGSYQPSHDMQLRFYSFFKQATEGRCTQKRPGIWNPVSRAKWEAWNRLGDMPREEAMDSYVEELKKIIETMSYTDNVADFMGSINELDGVSVDDLEAVAPEAIKKVRSQPNSPFASREASPVRAPYTNGHVHQNGGYSNHLTNGHVLSEALTVMNGNGGGYHNGHLTELSDDEYIDTIDDYEGQSFHSDSTTNASHTSRTKMRYQSPTSVPVTAHQVSQQQVVPDRRVQVAQGAGQMSSSVELDLRFHNVLSQLNLAVERMNLDVQQVMARMAAMEKALKEAEKSRNSVARRNVPKWWPFRELSPNWVIFIVLWPFVAHKLINMMKKRK